MNQFAIGGVEARPQARDTHPSHDGGRTAMVPSTVGIDARQSRTGDRPDGSFMSTREIYEWQPARSGFVLRESPSWNKPIE